MKKLSVVFTRNNARMLIGPLELHGPISGAVVEDANLEQVRNIPSFYWKLKDGNIIPMTQLERMERDFDIKHYGLVNDYSLPMVKSSILVTIWRFLTRIWR